MTLFSFGMLVGIWLVTLLLVVSSALLWWWLTRPDPRPNRRWTLVEWLVKHKLVK